MRLAILLLLLFTSLAGAAGYWYGQQRTATPQASRQPAVSTPTQDQSTLNTTASRGSDSPSTPRPTSDESSPAPSPSARADSPPTAQEPSARRSTESAPVSVPAPAEFAEPAEQAEQAEQAAPAVAAIDYAGIEASLQEMSATLERFNRKLVTRVEQTDDASNP